MAVIKRGLCECPTKTIYPITAINIRTQTLETQDPGEVANPSLDVTDHVTSNIATLQFPFRKRSLPFETVVAIFETVVAIHNSRCHFNPRGQ